MKSLECWGRMLIFGTLPKICNAEGMTSYLYERQIRIFDHPRFAEPFRNEEERVQEILAKRRDHPGMVCIFPAMEPCSTYKPWHNKSTGKTYLLPDDGKCLHYLDEELGLGYVRVPTWLPRRLQIYFNWSVDQREYATDIVFRRQAHLLHFAKQSVCNVLIPHKEMASSTKS
jgi:energy-converting hydrogenase A subunit M